MKILVTGAAGFIGYHTAKALLARGDEVVGHLEFCKAAMTAQGLRNGGRPDVAEFVGLQVELRQSAVDAQCLGDRHDAIVAEIILAEEKLL